MDGSTPVARRAFRPDQMRQQQMMQPTPRSGGGYYGAQPGLEMHKFITPTAQLTQWAGSMLNGVWGSSDPGPQQPQMQQHYVQPQQQQYQQQQQQPQQQFMPINTMNMGITQVQQQVAQTFAPPNPEPSNFQVRQIGADGIAVKPEEEISIATVCMKCLPCICCMLICFLLITVLPALSAEGKLAASTPAGGMASPSAAPLMIVRNCRSPNDIAITFQGGPAAFTHEVMDALEAVGARATFYVSGTENQCIYSRSSELRRMRRNGHMIGIRGWSGRSFQAMNRVNAALEIRRIRAAVLDIAGVTPQWFRPPGNQYTADTLAAFQGIAGRGAALGLFSVNGDDIAGNIPNFQQAHLEVTLDRFRSNGPVTVLHDASWNGARLFLPWVLTWARNNSLQMVTMGACQGMPEASFWYDDLVPVPGTPVDTSAAACTALEASIR